MLLSVTCTREASQDKPPRESPSAETTAKQAAPASEWTMARAHTALRDKNLGYNWNAAFRIEDGRVTGAELTGSDVTDISPLADINLQGLDLR